MQQVDPASISALLGTTILSALVMLYIWRIHFAERALAYCTAALLLAVCALGSLQLRALVPAPFAIVLSPAFALAGAFGLTLAIAAFVGRREPWPLAICTCAFVTGGIFYWSAIDENAVARSLLYSAGVFVAVGRSGWFLLSPASRPEGRARFAVLGVGAMMVTGASCRTLFAWPELAGRLSLSQAWLGKIWLVDAMVVEILLPVSMLLLTSERLLRDLERQACHDGLTGILNRRAFLGRADEECARAIRHGRKVAVLLLDLDHFKQINDTGGHHAGDAMLRAVVTTIKTTLRLEDLFCRFGGEEFCLLLPDVDLTGAGRLAERVRGLVAALRVPFEGRDLAVTISIGAAVIDAGQPSIQAALEIADRALYCAKAKGRNRIEIGGSPAVTPVLALP